MVLPRVSTRSMVLSPLKGLEGSGLSPNDLDRRRVPVKATTRAMNSADGTKRALLGIVFVTVCAFLTINTFAVDVLPQVSIPQDVFALLTGAEKMYRGLHPYTDYQMLEGPVPNFELVLSMWIAGPVPYAFVIEQGCTIPLISALVWFLYLRNHLTGIGLISGLYIVLTWCAPFVLHGNSSNYSYGMIYDRQGFALLCLLTLLCLKECTEGTLIFGILTAILFFIKIPFGLSGLILVGFYFRRNCLSLYRFVLGFALVFGAMLAFLGLDGLVAMFESVISAALIQPQRLSLARTGQLIYDLSLVILIFPSIFLAAKLKVAPLKSLMNEFFVVILATSISDYACSPTFVNPDLPPFVLFSFYLLERLTQRNTFEAIKTAYAMSGLLFVFTYSRFATSLLILALLSSNGYRNHPEIKFVNAAGFDRLPLYGGWGDSPARPSIAGAVNEGLDLIQKHPELHGARLACLDFTDWFSLPRHVPSPDHMPVVLQLGFTVSETHYPPPEFALQECSGVILWKAASLDQPGALIVQNAYASYLQEHFPKRDESPSWILLYR